MQEDLQSASLWGLTIQADDFSHGEGNVLLIWLCLIVDCLDRQEKSKLNCSGEVVWW